MSVRRMTLKFGLVRSFLVVLPVTTTAIAAIMKRKPRPWAVVIFSPRTITPRPREMSGLSWPKIITSAASPSWSALKLKTEPNTLMTPAATKPNAVASGRTRTMRPKTAYIRSILIMKHGRRAMMRAPAQPFGKAVSAKKFWT